ncbi:MAG: alternative oxidase [Patescibacteria group bacterium]
MELTRTNSEMEELNKRLNDDRFLEEYKGPGDGYRPSLLPRLLGGLLVFCGDLFYGEKPSYLKFRAIEVIARVPYHSWSSAAYTILTLFYFNEKRAMELSGVARYSALAQENETMHVVVITSLARAEKHANPILHTAIPILFAFFYFWAVYWLYLISPKWSHELNYVFEDHAFEQYDLFLRTRGEELRKKKVESAFLTWYGRAPNDQYEFFRSVRNDEMIHRMSAFNSVQMLTKRP